MSQRVVPRPSKFCWSQTFGLFFFSKHHRKTFEIDLRKTQLNALAFQTSYVFVSCFFLTAIPSLKVLLNNEIFLSAPGLSLAPRLAERWYRDLAGIMQLVKGLLFHTPNIILTSPRARWLASFESQKRVTLVSAYRAALCSKLIRLLFCRAILVYTL